MLISGGEEIDCAGRGAKIALLAFFLFGTVIGHIAACLFITFAYME